MGRRVYRGRTFALGTRTVPLSFSTGACASISPMSPVASPSQKVVVAPRSRATVPFPFSSKRAEEGKTFLITEDWHNITRVNSYDEFI